VKSAVSAFLVFALLADPFGSAASALVGPAYYQAIPVAAARLEQEALISRGLWGNVIRPLPAVQVRSLRTGVLLALLAGSPLFIIHVRAQAVPAQGTSPTREFSRPDLLVQLENISWETSPNHPVVAQLRRVYQVEDWIKLIQTDKFGNASNFAMHELAHSRDPRVTPLLLSHLNTQENYARNIIKTLVLRGDRQAVPGLIKALQESLAWSDTIEALSEFGDPRAIPPLMDALAAENILEKYDVLQALQKLGVSKPEIARHWILAAQKGSPSIQSAAIRALFEVRDYDATKSIATFPGCRAQLMLFLQYGGNYGNEASHVLSSILTANDWVSLYLSSHLKGQPPPTQDIEDTHNISMHAGHVIDLMRSDSMVDLLVARLHDPDSEHRYRAARLLLAMGVHWTEPVDQALLLVDAHEWKEVAALGPAAVPALENYLSNTTARVDDVKTALQLLKAIPGDHSAQTYADLLMLYSNRPRSLIHDPLEIESLVAKTLIQSQNAVELRRGFSALRVQAAGSSDRAYEIRELLDKLEHDLPWESLWIFWKALFQPENVARQALVSLLPLILWLEAAYMLSWLVHVLTRWTGGRRSSWPGYNALWNAAISHYRINGYNYPWKITVVISMAIFQTGLVWFIVMNSVRTMRDFLWVFVPGVCSFIPGISYMSYTNILRGIWYFMVFPVLYWQWAVAYRQTIALDEKDFFLMRDAKTRRTQDAFYRLLSERSEQSVQSWLNALPPARLAALEQRLPRLLRAENTAERVYAGWLLKYRSSPAAIPIFIQLHSDRDPTIHQMAQDGLSVLLKNPPEFDADEIIPDIITALSDGNDSVKKAAQATLATLIRHGSGRRYLSQALEATLKNLQNPTASPSALDTLAAWVDLKWLKADTFQSILAAANVSLQAIVHLGTMYPYLFEGRPIGRLLKAVQGELEHAPPVQRDDLLTQFATESARYFAALDPAERTEAEYGEVANLLAVVHDNLAPCLGSLAAAHMRIHDIEELKSALPINNPLTRIVRMFGESTNIIGGSLDVTSRVRKSGQWNALFRLLVAVAKEKQRAAPAEIGGIFEVLRAYGKAVETWTSVDWNLFSQDIRAYYDNGFKIITLRFFKFFREHKGDPAAVTKLRADLDASLKDIGWGQYFGLPDSLKIQFDLTDQEELSMLDRYVEKKNSSLQDFESPYRDVRKAIQELTPEGWQAEVPPAVRTLYTLKGTRTQWVYRSDEQADPSRSMIQLADHLVSWTESPDSVMTLDELVQGLTGDLPHIQAAFVARLPLFKDASRRAYFANFPEETPSRREWLSLWHTLIVDTLKTEDIENIRCYIEQIVTRASTSVKDLEPLLDRLGVWVPWARQTSLLMPADRAVVNAIKRRESDSLSEAIQAKWRPQIARIQVQDQEAFEAWVDRTMPGYLGHLENQKLRLNAADVDFLRSVIFQARARYASFEVPEVLRRSQLRRALTEKVLHAYDEPLARIETELGHFHEIVARSNDDLYVGFFDDLLHLAGEFMLSGVCTWNDRARQVRQGRDEGYHFGTLALKNQEGRVLGFSQVQLLKTPLRDLREASNLGYRVLALTGVNLSEKEIPIEKKKAIHVLLKAAYQLQKEAGLQAAVIVKEKSIHSNQEEVWREVDSLLSKKVLTPGRLASKIFLSKPPSAAYQYEEVYVIHDIAEVDITPTPVATAIQRQEQAEKLLEKKHLDFFDGLGQIRHNGEFAEPEAQTLRGLLDLILRAMPVPVLAAVREEIRLLGLSLTMVVDPQLQLSHVSRSLDEVTLYVGQDIRHAIGQFEFLGLQELVAEAVAGFVVPRYDVLKAESAQDEYAALTIAVVQALLNFRERLPLYHKLLHRYNWGTSSYWHLQTPELQGSLRAAYEQDLSRSVEGLEGLQQYNLFLNVMDDADPGFLIANYLHLLARTPQMAGNPAGVIQELIGKIAALDLSGEVRFSRVRNVLKEFVMDEKAYLQTGQEVTEKDRFNFFDDSERLQNWHDVLLTTADINLFYTTLGELVAYTLPLTEEEVSDEVGRGLKRNLEGAEDRGSALQEFIEDLLNRRLGSRARMALELHLTASRGTEEIPAFQVFHKALPDGDDADHYRDAEDLSNPRRDAMRRLFRFPGEGERGFAHSGLLVAWPLALVQYILRVLPGPVRSPRSFLAAA
jgi:HEAT repeat protein